MSAAILAQVSGAGVALAAPKPAATPESILPPVVAAPSPSPAAAPTPAPSMAPLALPTPAATPTPAPMSELIMPWTLGDAQALLIAINRIDEEGLIPADYLPDVLNKAIAAGAGPALDAAASKSFSWLAEDLRDGRTPMTSRLQWFAIDPDLDANPTEALMTKALSEHNVAGVLAGLAPTYPDYQVLKGALAVTPKADKAARALVRANMDRWRWLPRDLGVLYLITNVPEFQLRLRTNQRVVRTYRTIVGKPGKTATPQLAETVTAVVFNPTWTVPQSIIVGEGLGAKLLKRPDKNYKVTKAADGTLTVVQQPGPTNSLGLMKIDMPNPHAIYLHDTPNRNLFGATMRAMSHGCVRTENAQMLGMTMAMLGADLTPELAAQYALSGKYTKVPMTKTFPVYITYFTMGPDLAGNVTTFGDIYQRDAPVLASFAAPRQVKTSQRASTEKVIKLDNPL